MSKIEKAPAPQPEIISLSNVSRRIYTLGDRQVMLDEDLAEIYGVETKVLKQTVKRNIERFPEDFMWSTTEGELEIIRSQIVTENVENSYEARLTPKFGSQFVTESSKHGSVGRRGSRYAPFAFTEHGVAMLSSVLHSSQAIQVNIQIIRIFSQLRREQRGRLDFVPKLESLENMFKQRFDQLEARLQNPAQTLPEPAKHDTVRAVQNKVARHFGLNGEELKSASRIQPISLARQIAIFFMRKHLGMGFREIGRQLGGRDHSTILHAYRKIHVESEDNATVRKAVQTLLNEIQPILA